MRQLVWGAVLLVVLSTLVAGTGGFSAASAERPATIAVAPTHGDALVSIWDPGAGGAGGEPPMYAGEEPVPADGAVVTVVVVRNRFTERTLDFTVSDRDGSPVGVTGRRDDVAAGAVVPVDAAVDCRGHHGRVDVPLEVTATAADGSFRAYVNFRAAVVCPAPQPDPRSEG